MWMRIISFVSAFSAMPWRRKLSRVSRLLKTMLFMKIIFTLFLIMTIPLSVILVNKLRVINFLSLLQVIFPFLHLSLCSLMYALTSVGGNKYYVSFMDDFSKFTWKYIGLSINLILLKFSFSFKRMLKGCLRRQTYVFSLTGVGNIKLFIKVFRKIV